ncbi:alpha/beta hydrolase [Methylobacterium sp. WL116]|uniref:alpha/beta hydrolase n=1 Tax=Methylobacterium sp. WL116 TaxID=2603889 RepID=UPI0011C983A7|nr:alpha/beta hydrolase [Methylobacterium sp. WL116]TXM94942.1 alpha/beta hydrolase [Methylobacterium sp. WL116]
MDWVRLATRMMTIVAGILAPGAVPVAADGAAPPSPSLIVEDLHIPTADPGIELFLRSKRPRAMTTPRSERTLLFVSGSTYPAETSFDLPLDGRSWMDEIALHGWDVWFVELRGYGRSTRPPEMDAPPEANPPIVRTETAVRDLASAVDAIRARRGIERLSLLGWSWGTSIVARYTVAHPAKVVRLALYGPRWLRPGQGIGVEPQTTEQKPLPSYRRVTAAEAQAHWLDGVPDAHWVDLIPPGWFERWASATWATDPQADRSDPPALRAPNGTMADVRAFWEQGRPVYDPAGITVPTLLIGAEWDRDTPPAMRQALFPLLVNAPDKRYVELGGGTHMICLERNRHALFGAVQAFLDEAGPDAPEFPVLKANRTAPPMGEP